MSEQGYNVLNRNNIETETVGMTEEDVINALHLNGKFFIQFFLGDELEFEVPDFHAQSWDLITTVAILYIALALPRGHAKTTLCKLCCVWYLLFTDTRFIVYVSATASVAAEACKDIIAYIRSDNFVSVFGHAEFTMDREAHGFYKFFLNTPDGKGGFIRKLCILKALGAEQQVRGLNINNERPQLAIVDDLEDNENTATLAAQRKLKMWFFGAFIKALSKKRRKVIYLGNMLSNQSILYYMCEKSDEWHSIRYGALLSNGEPLWPDVWSFEDLQKDYIEYQKNGLTALWFAEMMNMPMAEGASLIMPDEIPYQPMVMPEQCSTAFITLDPAISQKAWGNDSAICVHGWIADRWQVVETVHGKFEPEKLYQIIIELCLKWNTRIVGIEQGGYQLGLRFIFQMLMKAYNQHFVVYEIPHKNVSKVERLTIWCAALRKKLWVLTEGDHVITQQLLNFDPLKGNNVDDVIDSCSMGITMTNMYMPEIMEKFKFSNDAYVMSRVISN